MKTIGNFGVANIRKSPTHLHRPRLLFYLFLLLLTQAFTRCANPVSPMGGPKDKLPPVILSCDPPSKSVHFSQKNIKIEFNEFIELKNAATEIFISPPMKKPLETRLRGKSLVLQFEDSLKPNTTYSLSFGNAITDLTEGNILKGFNYVLSTGAYVDSLSLQGTVISAFDHMPQKDIYVGIYFNNNDTIPFDSLPLRVPPDTITRTNDKGQFVFNNIQNKSCRIFAISDQNGDLVFNQPTEKIAYKDSLVNPFYIGKLPPDTLKRSDSLKKVDSIRQMRANYPNYQLLLFEQSDSVQHLVKSSFPEKGHAMLIFRFPVEHLQLKPLNFDSVASWYLPEYSSRHDTVNLWITRPETDSVRLKVTSYRQTIDTIELALPASDLGRKKGKQDKSERIFIQQPNPGSILNQFKNKLILTFSKPVIRFNPTGILLLLDKDTLKPVISFADSLHRRFRVDYPWQEEKAYRLLIPDSAFTGLGGISHDTIIMSFRTAAEKDYGNLIVSFNLPEYDGQYIVQLLNEKENIIYGQRIVTKNEKIRFDFMPPGKYKLKAIKDKNKNNRWDSGNYNKLLQPEDIYYVGKIVEIRANWDVEETWN